MSEMASFSMRILLTLIRNNNSGKGVHFCVSKRGEGACQSAERGLVGTTVPVQGSLGFEGQGHSYTITPLHGPL